MARTTVRPWTHDTDSRKNSIAAAIQARAAMKRARKYRDNARDAETLAARDGLYSEIRLGLASSYRRSYIREVANARRHWGYFLRWRRVYRISESGADHATVMAAIQAV